MPKECLVDQRGIFKVYGERKNGNMFLLNNSNGGNGHF